MPKATELNRRNPEEFVHRATSIFTDREDLRESYHNILRKALKEDFSEYYAILYYGIGGVGKTTLLKKLMDEVREETSYRTHQPVILHVDFDSPGMDDSILALLHMKKQLCRQVPKSYFPLFDTALFLIKQKTGEEFETEQQIEDIFDNPVLAFGLELLDATLGTAIIDAARRAAVKLGKEAREWLVRRKAKLKSVLQEMKELDDNALIRNLADYFASDVNRIFADMPERLICVFLDTYERLDSYVHSGQKLSRTYQRDQWIHGNNGLMRLMGNTVFAIAGRNRPLWADEDPLWAEKQNLEKHLTKGLSEENSREFLRKNNIVDYDIQSVIYRLTNGEPVYLDLCVRQYRNSLMSGTPKPEDFGSSINELIDRHLRYIKDEMRDELCLMASMRRWTDELYDTVTGRIGMNAVRSNSSSYGQLMKLSYIDIDADMESEGFHTMHSVVANLLAIRLPEKIKTKAVSTLCGLWQEKALTEGHPDDTVLEAALSVAGWREADAQEIKPASATLSETDEALIHILHKRAEAEHHAFRKIFWHEYGYKILRNCLGENDHRTVSGIIRLSDDYCCAGHYLEAEALLENQLKTLPLSAGENAQSAVAVMVALAESKRVLEDHDAYYSLIEKACALQKEAFGETNPDTMELMLKYAEVNRGDTDEILKELYHCYGLFADHYGKTHEKTYEIIKRIFYYMDTMADPMHIDNVDPMGNRRNERYAKAAIELAVPYETALAENGKDKEALQTRRFIGRMKAFADEKEAAVDILQSDLPNVKQLFGENHEEVLWQLIYLAKLSQGEKEAEYISQIRDFLTNHPKKTWLLHQLAQNLVEEHSWTLPYLIHLEDKINADTVKKPFKHEDFPWLPYKKNQLQMILEDWTGDRDTGKYRAAMQLTEAMQSLLQKKCSNTEGTDLVLTACEKYADETEETAPELDEIVIDTLCMLCDRNRSEKSPLAAEGSNAAKSKAIGIIRKLIELQIAQKGELSPDVYDMRTTLLDLCSAVNHYDIAASVAEQQLNRQIAAYGKNHYHVAEALNDFVYHSLKANISLDKEETAARLKEIIQSNTGWDGWMCLMDVEQICEFLEMPVVWIELCDILFQNERKTEPDCLVISETEEAEYAGNNTGRAMKELVNALREYMWNVYSMDDPQLSKEQIHSLNRIIFDLHRVYEQYNNFAGMDECGSWITMLPAE